MGIPRTVGAKRIARDRTEGCAGGGSGGNRSRDSFETVISPFIKFYGLPSTRSASVSASVLEIACSSAIFNGARPHYRNSTHYRCGPVRESRIEGCEGGARGISSGCYIPVLGLYMQKKTGLLMTTNYSAARRSGWTNGNIGLGSLEILSRVGSSVAVE